MHTAREWFFLLNFISNKKCPWLRAYTRGGARGQCHPLDLQRYTQSFHTFQILNWRVKNIKNSLLFIQCTKKIVYVNKSHHNRSPNKKSRMHIQPNQMGAIRDSKVKQLFSSAKPRRLEFWCSKTIFFLNLELIYFIHCTAFLLSFSFLQTRWSAQRCPWNFKTQLKQKT